MSSLLDNHEASIMYWVSASVLTNYNEINSVIETDKQILEAKLKFSLSDIELKVLHFYTADGAQHLNPFTQSVFKSVSNPIHHLNMSNICQILTTALNKIPIYSETVYRHDNFNGYEDFLEKHKVGEIVHYSSFLSSSKFVDRYPEGKVQLTIKSKTGRDMSWISYSKFYPENEEEILFAPITYFLVVDRFEKNDRIFISLLEVEQGKHK